MSVADHSVQAITDATYAAVPMVLQLNQGTLARRDGGPIAFLSCLGMLHGELRRHWYVEAVFATELVGLGQVLASLEQSEGMGSGRRPDAGQAAGGRSARSLVRGVALADGCLSIVGRCG